MGEGERERERDLTCFTFYSKAPLLRSNFFVISQQLLLLFFFYCTRVAFHVPC